MIKLALVELDQQNKLIFPYILNKWDIYINTVIVLKLTLLGFYNEKCFQKMQIVGTNSN